jgi:RNase adaptor protein for sRNA GlmZ degradation
MEAEQRFKPNRKSCCRCTDTASRDTVVVGRVSHKSSEPQNNTPIESGMQIVDEMLAVWKPDSRETLTLTIVCTEGH